MQTAIPCALMRGGSSKGLYVLRKHLPENSDLMNSVLLALMGGSDPRQIDGLGGAHPLTSKMAIVGKSERQDADVEYLFAQAVVGEARIDLSPTCGNILAGVGPFAIENGLVPLQGDITPVRVYMVNTGKVCEVKIVTKEGYIHYDGDAVIDGVPGSGAPILCEFPDAAGSSCGALLPTGNLRDTIDGIEVTCIDGGMPVVLLKAEDFGLKGDELPTDLSRNEYLVARLDAVRLKVGPMMNLGDVTDRVVPKMSLLSPAQNGGHISTRTFIPKVCHAAIGVLGAASVAAGCAIPGTICSDFLGNDFRQPPTIRIEHPSGHFDVTIDLRMEGNTPTITHVGLLRTARLLMRGEAMIPSSIWAG